MKKILLHACCAPCSAYCIEKLNNLGYQPVLYFYNPNIYPESEFERRLLELERYCTKKNIELITEKYEPNLWSDFITGLEWEEEGKARCARCFELRLLKAAIQAIKSNISLFTTTLTISPHKNSNKIFEIGLSIAEKYQLSFLDINFKKEDGFLKTMQIAKEENFYRQTYCGCEYSMN